MSDCIFCKIINNELPSYRVYEDDKAIVILDINPVNKGHVLVIPKKHSQDLLETNDEILQHLITVSKKIGKAVLTACNSQGFNLSVNNGAVAGQVIFHLHVHIVPRFGNDNLKLWPGKKYKDEEAEKLVKIIKDNL